MRPNAIKELFKQKKTAWSGWASIGNPYSAEVLGHSGVDAVVVDLQHGMIYLDQAFAMLAAISATPAMPMVRVSENQFFEANKLLDAGAYGVICPMIDDADAARRFVGACRYPPMGTRSFGPTRGLLYGGPDYFTHANDTILTLGMIETPLGLKNLDEIAAVPGLDGLFIGPSDLSIALGVAPSPDWTNGPLSEAIDRILAAARRHGKIAGIFCVSVEFAEAMRDKGFDYINLSNDAAFIRASGAAWLGRLRGK
ncbi:MAG: HpcH/HpaI aldolase/citrate lyase family protein [Lautropia sp.]